MRIGLLLPDILTSRQYGAERIFAPLPLAVDVANGLLEKGHQVFFYTATDVATQATIIPGNEALLQQDIIYERAKNLDEQARIWRTDERKKAEFEHMLTLQSYQDALRGKLDILHSFHNFMAHYFNELTQFPTIYTLHDPLPQTPDSIEYQRYKLFSKHNYVSISMSQRNSMLALHFVANIYHGVTLSRYPFVPTGGDDLVFVGRIVPDKGVDKAIAIAQDEKKTVHIATSGNYQKSRYYNQVIAPLIDGEKVTMHSFFPTDEEKAAFLGKGKAFLFPLQWEEPFGMVMIESMACGTPVIAYARGSVPEIIVDGETGFLVNPSDDDIRGDFIIKKTGIEGMKEAVARLYALSESEYTNMRLMSRKRVESHFTASRMVDDYENLYKTLLHR